jgi:PhoD-like phosphatase
MPSNKAVNRLKLGPIVGHTDEKSSRIWIQALDDPSKYQLRVQSAGVFAFESTETSVGLSLEFRTAIASATGLRPDWRYRYNVLRNGRSVPGAKGTFRTMPISGSMANILFCAISCNTATSNGAWEAFGRFVNEAKPHFIIMMGDQVYIDEDNLDVFDKFVESSSAKRRKALAEKYRESWSRNLLKQVMANVPIYMMWDDHEIRDGFGSLASDSETLVQKYPRGKDIFQKCITFFEDARDVYWHFQACHNLPDQPLVLPPEHGKRQAMPFVFKCGRLMVLMLDSRGERDVFREDFPILGPGQWQFINGVLDTLSDDVDALAIMTPTPIASMDPAGQSQKLLGNRTDDVDSFKKGDFHGLFNPHKPEGTIDTAEEFVKTAISAHLTRITGKPMNWGYFQLSKIDEVRDQWSHKFARPEQEALISQAAKAKFTNRTVGTSRELIFLSGDIHIGCIFDITISKPGPEYKAVSLTSSGISANEGEVVTVGTVVDEDFDVAPGIHSTLRQVVNEVNFGVVQMIPTGTGAEIVPTLAHEGNSWAVGLDFADLL